MNDLPAIQSIFDTELASAFAQFESELTPFVDLLIKRVSTVPYEPISSTDVFDSAISSFSVGVGDSTTGIYGNYVVNLTSVIERSTQSINTWVASLSIRTEKQLKSVQDQINALSDHISASVADVNTKVSSLLTSANDRFTSALTTSQIKASKFYIIAITDSFIAAINRADKRADESVKRLVALYVAYKSIPIGFYDDVNSILTEISSEYNDEINNANTSYNTALSAYKYYSSAATDQMTASQLTIKNAIDISSAKLSALFDEVSRTFTYKTDIERADLVTAYAIAAFSSRVFDETVRIRNKLNNLIYGISKKAEITLRALERYFVSGYHPIFVDGVDYRNGKSALANGASKLISDALTSLYEEYNNTTSVLGTNYSTFLNDMYGTAVEYVNDNVKDLTDDRVSDISNRLSVAVGRYNDRVSSYFTVYSGYLSYISDGLSSHLKKYMDQYYTNVPLIRFTGDINTPSRISKYDSITDDDGNVIPNNVFTFGVTNVGKLLWQGWFGIRFTSTVDLEDYSAAYYDETGEEYTGDYETPTFKWNYRTGFEFVFPGQTRMITISVPGSKIYNLSELGSTIIPNIIANTYLGGLQSLLVK
jgi:hypothetical protein